MIRPPDQTEPMGGGVEFWLNRIQYVINVSAGGPTTYESRKQAHNALDDLHAHIASLETERDAIGAALGEPCAECGHIDWRSDGYADRFLVAEARLRLVEPVVEAARLRAGFAGEHHWRCEYRTKAKGWEPGQPPVIECICGLEALDEVLRALDQQDDRG